MLTGVGVGVQVLALLAVVVGGFDLVDYGLMVTSVRGDQFTTGSVVGTAGHLLGQDLGLAASHILLTARMPMVYLC